MKIIAIAIYILIFLFGIIAITIDNSLNKNQTIEFLKKKYGASNIEVNDNESTSENQNFENNHFKLTFNLKGNSEKEDGFVSQIMSSDEKFSKSKFKQKAIGCFLKLQNAK